jgi:hypothetical protein
MEKFSRFKSGVMTPGASSSGFRSLNRFGGVLCLGVSTLLATALSAAPFREVPPPSFAQIKPAAPPPKPKPEPKDELLFEDGDRVRGQYIEREGDILVFRSDRFGILRVPVASAKLTLANPPPEVAKEVQEKSEGSAEADVDVEHSIFSPLALAEALKEFFGSWHGRFSVSAEMMEDSAVHNSGTVEGQLRRKWERDEVQLSGRYDYSTVDQTVSATDMIKGSGVWRHDFPTRLFGVYRPTLEWNRAYFRDGLPADYVLLQQELGVGVTLLDTDKRKVRVGVSENLFDTWITPTETHLAQTTESVFAEIEAKLPWRIVVTDRGVWYYSFADQNTGWENRFEISKKLTETVTMGLRHEVRHNNPDVRSADYRRLRLLFGFDF